LSDLHISYYLAGVPSWSGAEAGINEELFSLIYIIFETNSRFKKERCTELLVAIMGHGVICCDIWFHVECIVVSSSGSSEMRA